ncbi:MAG: ABC transporter substrate-binding protein [Candidatus Bathyarchaeia archaeon]
MKTKDYLSMSLLLLSVSASLISVAGMITPFIVSAQEIVLPPEQTFTYIFGGDNFVDICPFNPSSTPTGVNQLYERLAYMDSYSGGMNPLLAESWGFIDDYTFEIKLRPQARWSDGTPVKAEDVVFSLQSFTDPTYGGSLRPEVKEYIAVNDLTVHIKLKDEYPKNRRVLGVLIDYDIIPKKRWAPLLAQYGRDILSYTDLDDLSSIITSAAYLPYYASPDRKRFIMIRNENYWGKEIGWFFHPKYLDFQYVGGGNEGTVRVGYIERKTDWSAVGFNEPQFYKENNILCWDIKAEPSGMFYNEPCCLPIAFNFNYTQNSVHVFRFQWLREALLYATDAEASLVSGWNLCGRLYTQTFLNPDLPDYELYANVDALKRYFETEVKGGIVRVKYSPQKAIQILQKYCDGSPTEGWTIKPEVLAAAGYDPSITVKLGYPEPWTIQAVNGWTDTMIEVKIVAECWSSIGIPTIPVYPEFGTWMSNYASGTFCCTMMWSWCYLVDTPNPIADTFYSNFVQYTTPPNIWVGSPGLYPLFFDGNHPPLPNTAEQVKNLVLSLYQMEPGTPEYINTVKQIQEILIPQVPFIMTHTKASTEGFITDRWVNFPTKYDPFEHRLDKESFARWLLLKHVRPRSIETLSFSISPGMTQAGKTAMATVTLRNKADCELDYKVEIALGEPKPGPGPEVIASKVVTVPARSTLTVHIPVTFEQPGTYVLTVDDWRVDEFDPGDPLTVLLTVTEPVEVIDISALLNAIEEARQAAERARSAAEDARAAAQSATEMAMAARASAEAAAPAWMVWASTIIVIVVVLAGVAILIRRISPPAES